MGQLTQNESKDYLGMEGLGKATKTTLPDSTTPQINWVNVRNKLRVNVASDWKSISQDIQKSCGVGATATMDEVVEAWIATAEHAGAKTEDDAISGAFFKYDSKVQDYFASLICKKAVPTPPTDSGTKSTQDSGWSMPTWGYFAIAGGVVLFGWLIFRKK